MFKELGSEWNVSAELFDSLEAFIYQLYGSKNGTTDVNTYRYHMFCSMKGEVESFQLLPYKCLPCCYQAGMWKRSLEDIPKITSPVGMGWKLEEHDGQGVLVFNRMDGEPAQQSVMWLLACKCTHACTASDCQCISNGMLCTDMCKLKTCNN